MTTNPDAFGQAEGGEIEAMAAQTAQESWVETNEHSEDAQARPPSDLTRETQGTAAPAVAAEGPPAIATPEEEHAKGHSGDEAANESDGGRGRTARGRGRASRARGGKGRGGGGGRATALVSGHGNVKRRGRGNGDGREVAGRTTGEPGGSREVRVRVQSGKKMGEDP